MRVQPVKRGEAENWKRRKDMRKTANRLKKRHAIFRMRKTHESFLI